MILITMSSTCSMYLNNSCHYSDSFPAYIFWQCSNMDLMNDGSLQINALLWLLWLLSQIWLSFHVFTSSCAKCDRLASTDKLFLKPVYESLILGKCLDIGHIIVMLRFIDGKVDFTLLSTRIYFSSTFNIATYICTYISKFILMYSRSIAVVQQNQRSYMP